MSWLNERDITYIYNRPDGQVVHLSLPAADTPPKKFKCDDGVIALYAGFQPEEVRQTNIVEYDQNGRKAVRIKDKDGTIRHMSKTKLKYLKTGQIENQYTKSYKEHLVKTQQEQLLKSGVGRGKGKAEEARGRALKEKIGKLPDGEYLSDGQNFFTKKGV